MSWKAPTAPVIVPWSSRSGAALTRIGMRVPSSRSMMSSCATTVSPRKALAGPQSSATHGVPSRYVARKRSQ